MDIGSRTVGDIIVLDLKGTYIWKFRPSRTPMATVKDLLEAGHRKFLINLTKAEIESDTGLGDLLGSVASVQTQKGTVKITAVSERTLRLFKITGVDQVFEIHPTLEAGLESFTETLDE